MAALSEHTVQLAKPGAGSALQESMAPGVRHLLDFYPEQASFEKRGPDLHLVFDDGAALTLTGFFSVLEQGDFTLELPDGTLLSGLAVEEALTMVLEDFHTNTVTQDNQSPDTGDGDNLPFALHEDHPVLFCHESCGLLDDNISLPGAPDPHFDLHMTPLRPLPSLTSPQAPPALPDSSFLRPQLSPGAGDILRAEELLDTAPEAPGAFDAFGGRDVIWGSTDKGAAHDGAFDTHAPSLGSTGPGAAAELDWLLVFSII